LPAGYHLDLLSDPSVIILRRPAGTLVARFTPFVDPKKLRQAAGEDLERAEKNRMVKRSLPSYALLWLARLLA
jgi:hypothetical protein